MMRIACNAIVAAALWVGLTPIAARAECAQDPRKVSLDAQNTVLLKRYTCGIGRGDHDRIHVEFHRLAPNIAGLLMAGGSSTKLRQSLGSPKIVENEVWRAYAQLNAKFGELEKVPKKSADMYSTLRLVPAASKQDSSEAIESEDLISLKQFRHTDSSPGYHDYPAADEIIALLRKSVSKNLNYGFTIMECELGSEMFCTKFHNTKLEVSFWRPLSTADFENYSENTEKYNSNLMKIRKNAKFAKEDAISIEPPATLRLLAYVAGDKWPDDFAIMTALYTPQIRASCGEDNAKITDLIGLNGWSFSYTGRALALDAVVIENASSQPIVLDSLTGYRAATTKLRALEESTSASGATPLDPVAETLAPGARLLIPIRIALTPAPGDDEDAKKFVGAEETELRKALAGHLAAKGFNLEADNFKRPPLAQEYAYGPELIVSGVMVNSKAVSLGARHAANEIDLSVTPEAGSCPYLLSWSEEAHDWVKEGKVLHEAPSADRAYADTRRFEGLRTRFRIEEREPEVAHLKSVRLKLTLANGETLELAPTKAEATAGQDLRWGDGVNFDFVTPEGLDPRRVIETALTVEGFYRRYASMAANESAAPESARGSKAVCVAPSNAGVRASLTAQ